MSITDHVASESAPVSWSYYNGIWAKYVQVAEDFDREMVDSWGKVIDMLQILNGFFLTVVVAFVIESNKGFRQNPAEISSQLLAQIYLRLHDSSAPFVDPNQFFQLEPKRWSEAVIQNAFLYTSLSLLLIVGAIVGVGRLYLLRYLQTVTAVGSLYDRAKRRHTAYKGLLSWKLLQIIEGIAVVIVIVSFLLGLCIFSVIREEHKNMSLAIGLLFSFSFSTFLVTSATGTFIPGSPFTSSISDFIGAFYRIVFPYSSRSVRNSGILLASIGALVVAPFLSYRTDSPAFQSLLMFPMVSVIALTKCHDASPKAITLHLSELPQWTYFSMAILYVLLAFATHFLRRSLHISIPLYLLSIIFLTASGFWSIRMSSRDPEPIEFDIAAWVLERSAFSDKGWLKSVTRQTAELTVRDTRLTILQRMLPVLTTLILSVPHEERHGPIGDDQDLYIYLYFLHELCKPSFLDRRSSSTATRIPSRFDTGAGSLLVKQLSASWRRAPQTEDDIRLVLPDELVTRLEDMKLCLQCHVSDNKLSQLAEDVLESRRFEYRKEAQGAVMPTPGMTMEV